ncbi:MAG: TonB-dependent receptor [Verrucomicrobiota bacterium]
MKLLTHSWRGLCLLLATALTLVSPAFGQGITSASLSGRISDIDGQRLAGASVVAIHQPSGTRFESTTGPDGRYLLSNLRTGGPYTVVASADGFQPVAQDQVFTSLSRTREVDLRFTESSEEIIELEAFVVTGSGLGALDSTAMGISTNVDEVTLATAPVVRRNLNDIARFNPLAAITEDDRNELAIAGQNTRFNSIMIDGVRVNDQFGLESSGQTSLNSPVSLDTIEQVAIEVAPYDVRQTGFTGGAINVVTKSGTNAIDGSVYYYFYNEDLRGDEPNGDNDPIEEITKGVTLGGPILKDRLFFFVAYEEFSREEAGGSAFYTPDPDALAAVAARGSELGLDFGSFGAAGTRETTEDKLTLKLDWNINDLHRLAVKYFSNEGTLPNVGNFDDFGETALDTNFYTQLKDEEQWSAQLYSSWTDTFTTEISAGWQKFRQPTTFPAAIPQIFIDEFPEDNNGAGYYDASSSAGDFAEFYIGTEQFRHANNLEWDTYNFSAAADWQLGGHFVTFGVDMEQSEFANLFLESAFGNFSYDTLEDFLNDELSEGLNSYRNTGVIGEDPVARPDYTITGLFVQDVFEPIDRLSILVGARLDFITADNQPPTAFTADGATFESVFGFPNNATIDGEMLFAPRVGFNYQLDEESGTQLRGGIGLFAGRSPAVWIANAFTNNGATTNRVTFDPDSFSLDDYVASDFDPENPIIEIERAAGTPEVNVTEEDLQMPSSWRANLALDQRLGESNWVVTAEFLVTVVNEALWVENANLNPAGTSPDGRSLFDGLIEEDFDDVFVLRNTSKGHAENFVVQLSKEFSDSWYFNASYTYGSSLDVNPFTSSRASSNYNSRVVFEQNVAEDGVSNFEVKHRFLLRAGYDFEFLDGWFTRVGLVYEGRSGRPYSATFGNDFNGDGIFGNDAFYVPTGPNDPLVTFSSGTDVGAFFAYLEERGYMDYAGGAVPRNAKDNEFVHRWDINLTQEIPLGFQDLRFELFANFLNVGNMLNDEWGLVEEYGFPFRERIANGRIVNNGSQIEIDFRGGEESAVRVGARRSRWAIMVGGRLEF